MVNGPPSLPTRVWVYSTRPRDVRRIASATTSMTGSVATSSTSARRTSNSRLAALAPPAAGSRIISISGMSCRRRCSGRAIRISYGDGTTQTRARGPCRRLSESSNRSCQECSDAMMTSSTLWRSQSAGSSSRPPSSGTSPSAAGPEPSPDTAPTMSMPSQCCTRIVSITSAAVALVPTTSTRRRG